MRWQRLKIWIVVLIISVVISASTLAFATVAGVLLCAERKGAEIPSPDGRYAAQVIETNCGATTSFATGVILTDRRQPLPLPYIRYESIFGYDGKASGLSVIWQDSRQLVIKFARCTRVSDQRSVWHDIQITYQGVCQ